jgi:hypothetical protein
VTRIPDTVRPVVAPTDAQTQYAEWADKGGLSASELACLPLWPDQALICFQVTEGNTRRWVHSGDLEQWKVDAEGLLAVVRERSRTALEHSPQRTPVPDMDAWYWVSAEGDGWAASGLLHPEVLAARMGGAPILVSAPVVGALIAWHPGDAELDKVMAVGIRKMFEREPSPVTPVVHQWTGDRWVPFGEAVPSSEPDEQP